MLHWEHCNNWRNTLRKELAKRIVKVRRKTTWESLHLGPEEKEEIAVEEKTESVTTWPKANGAEHVSNGNATQQQRQNTKGMLT
jgi:hypothetical protein